MKKYTETIPGILGAIEDGKKDSASRDRDMGLTLERIERNLAWSKMVVIASCILMLVVISLFGVLIWLQV